MLVYNIARGFGPFRSYNKPAPFAIARGGSKGCQDLAFIPTFSVTRFPSLKRPQLPLQPVLITASALAPVTFGASPIIDPALHQTPPLQTRGLPNFTTALQTETSSSPSSSLPLSVCDLSRPSSTSTQSSNTYLPSQHPISSGDNKALNFSPSLTRLSALASVASAPTSHLRYVLPLIRVRMRMIHWQRMLGVLGLHAIGCWTTQVLPPHQLKTQLLPNCNRAVTDTWESDIHAGANVTCWCGSSVTAAAATRMQARP
ncbi:hypothetical protein GX48_08151 [Paracoccidioides brasiliensis]|nr:hypothetical protein GX48_08151 [Paracoccidioides brasiliensis]